VQWDRIFPDELSDDIHYRPHWKTPPHAVRCSRTNRDNELIKCCSCQDSANNSSVLLAILGSINNSASQIVSAVLLFVFNSFFAIGWLGMTWLYVSSDSGIVWWIFA
jgi:hypothetical protein